MRFSKQKAWRKDSVATERKLCVPSAGTSHFEILLRALQACQGFLSQPKACRHEVSTSTPYKDREAERHARMQKTQEAGKAFRELVSPYTSARRYIIESYMRSKELLVQAQQKREQQVAEEPEKTGREQPAESMEVEVKSLEPG